MTEIIAELTFYDEQAQPLATISRGQGLNSVIEVPAGARFAQLQWWVKQPVTIAAQTRPGDDR